MLVAGEQKPLLPTITLFLALAGCVPHVIWTGRDPARLMKAEIVAEDHQQWLRIGDTQGEHFDAVGTDGIVIARNGSVAYPAVRGGKWFMISGAKTFGPFDSIAEPRFSPDGARLAFVGQSPEGFHAVVDGVPSRAFEHIQPGTLQFSRNSAHLAFVGSDKGCAAIVVDGVQAPCRDRILNLRVSDSGAAAAVIREGRKERFLLAGEPGPAYDEIAEWEMSETGRIAYAGRTGTRWVLVLDNIVSSDCLRVHHVRFGDNGRRTAYVCAEKELASVVVDLTTGPAFPILTAPVLAAHAPDFAYIARDERGAWVVAGDSMLGPYAQAVDLVVARGGGGFAFVARSAGVTRIVHSGHEIPVDAAVEGSLVLSEDGAHWAAITGESANQSLWITVDGARLRRLVASEVFGDPTAVLGPWIERELRDALKLAGAP